MKFNYLFWKGNRRHNIIKKCFTKHFN